MMARRISSRSIAPSFSGALLVLALALPAAAQTGPCPPTCAGTGHEVYSEAQFVGIPGEDIYNLGPNFFLDASYTNADGSARGIIDLSSGRLKAFASSAGLNGAGILAQGVDRFTLGGVAAGTLVNLTAHLIANGTGLIPEPARSVQTMIQLGLPGGTSGSQLLVFQAGNNTPVNEIFNIAMSAHVDFTVVSGTPFLFGYFLRLQSGNGPGNQLDFLSTALLSFDMPAGMTLTSDGGFSAAAVAVTPEPATLLLVASGLAALAATRRRRIRDTIGRVPRSPL